MKRIALVFSALVFLLSDPSALHRKSETQARERGPTPVDAVQVDVRPVGLRSPRYEGPQSVPRFVGGLQISSRDTDRLHGLSAIRIDRSGHLLAVSDEGDVLEATLVSDEDGAPAAVSNARLRPLRSDGGASVGTKQDGDAEGLAVLADGRILVSFERNHRILVYRSILSAPERAPLPRAALTPNRGLEALTSYPSAGGDAYLAGTGGGALYLCRISRSCEAAGKLRVTDGYSLTALAADPQGRIYLLLRSHDPIRGTRVRIVSAVGPELADPRVVIQLEPPATLDNFEGLEFRIDERGRRFLYMISDDNFSHEQRTLLLAFRLD
jgi:hypothetical protein